MMSNITREVTGGRIRGARVAKDRVDQFLGVPYGGAVDGRGRFLPPSAVEPWDGIRGGFQLGPAAPQPPFGFPGDRAQRMLDLIAELRCTEPQGENCLVLNVWAPTASSPAPRPVMFSIHGGGFNMCSGGLPAFDGASLAAAHDVVVVSPNHRLGALGYLSVGALLGDDYASSGNAGTLDLIAALGWVRQNIATFGGDPGNVTMFGESGGGAKVCTLLAAPDAAGLFHRAIVQSGPMLTATEPEAAAATSRALLGELGLDDSPERLLTVPAQELVDAERRLMAAGRRIGPVMDGIVLPRHPFAPDAPPVSSSVPVLVGTTKDEMRFFTYPNSALDQIDDTGAVEVVRTFTGDHAAAIYDTYCRTRPDAAPIDRLSAIMSERFRIPSIRLAERKAAAGGAPVWMYRFDYATDALGGALGAPHAVEVAYTFANPDITAFSGKRPDRHRVAEATSRCWATFARTGNPCTADTPGWLPYDSERRATLLIDSAMSIAEDPNGDERLAWDGIDVSL